MPKFKTKLNLGTSLIVLSMAATYQPVYAADGETSVFDEIVVTARRSSESLQDVPATVSVLTESVLQKTGINTVDKIVGLTPGVSIVTNTAEVGDTQINIRGINGARDAENNIALVVDGILKTNTAQITQVHGELSQAEVLKGPQGAYYGRNAAAGAVVLTTKKPGDEFAGSIEASYAENSTFAATATVSGPISDNAGFVLYADYLDTDGHYRNTGPIAATQGATVDAAENITLGARLVFTPSETSEIDVKARYAKFDGSALSFNPTFHLPGFAGAFGNPLFAEDVNDHNFEFIGNILPQNEQETIEFSIKGTWEFDTVTLTAWALYSDVDQAWIADSTAATFYRFELQPSCIATTADLLAQGFQLPSPQLLLPTPFTSVFGPFGPTTCDGTQYQVREQEDYSAEIRLASNTDDPLQWSIGAYYLKLDRDTSVSIAEDQGLGPVLNFFNDSSTVNPTSLLFADSFSTDVYAAFGSVDYDFNDQLNVSVALRYDREERDVSSRVPNVEDQALLNGAPINPGLPAVGMIPDASNAFEEVQPKISISYAPNDDWNLFANWGVGFKAGGFNNQGSNAVINDNFNTPLGSGLVINDQYRKETSSSFEVGAKGSFADGRVTFEVAGFYTDVTDMQFFEFFTGGFGLLRVVSNIDEVELYGIESAINARVTDELTVYGAVAVTESEIKANGARPDTEGNKSPYTPDYTINLGMQYITDISNDLEASLRLDWRLTGPTWFHTVQDQEIRTSFDLFFPGLGTADYAETQRDAYDTLDLRLELSSEVWRITFFGTNLFDTDVLSEVIPAAEFGGSFVAPGAGRTLGVEVGFRF